MEELIGADRINLDKYVVKDEAKAAGYERAGYPRVIGNLKQAIDVGRRYHQAEMQTRQDSDRTPTEHPEKFPSLVFDQNTPIPLIEIPISELNQPVNHVIPVEGTPDRLQSVRSVIRSREDLTKLPPPVLTYRQGYGWTTIDGQNRIAVNKEIGERSVVAYYVDENKYQKADARRYWDKVRS